MKDYISRLKFQLAELRKEPLFIFGILLKLVLGCLFASSYLRDMFIPFINDFVSSGFSNPWDAYLEAGNTKAFPYSGLMLFILSSPFYIAQLIAPDFLYNSIHFKYFLARLPLFLADISILFILINWFRGSLKKVLSIYWLSPILIYISYVHGQLDVLPTAFLFLSLFSIFRAKFFRSGLFLGAGIACKFHVLGALPFVLIYLGKNVIKQKNVLKRSLLFLAGVLIPIFVFIIPLLDSEGYRLLVLGTSEFKRMFVLKYELSSDTFFYFTPAVLLILFLRFISSYKVNKELLLLTLTLVFSTLSLLVPPTVGWYYWSLPFICYFFIKQEEIKPYVYWVLNLLFVVNYASEAKFIDLPSFSFEQTGGFSLQSLLLTTLQATLAITIYWVYKLGIKRNQLFRHKKMPVLLGVGGDSGAGKDTFVAVLTSLLGKDNWVQNNGDDYHRWERGHNEWSSKTHLDPQANHMHLPLSHIESLKKGKTVSKQAYDHDTGKFTEPVLLKPKPFVLFVGLHPFYLRKMRSLLDIKVFVSPSENLRLFWKIQRDRKKRGYSSEEVIAQIKKREEDSVKYIQSQKAHADWVVSYQTDDLLTDKYENNSFKPELYVEHRISNDVEMDFVVEALSSIEKLQVGWRYDEDLEYQYLSFKGSITEEQIERAAFKVFPNCYELLGHDEILFKDSYEGLCQLVFLSILNSREEDSDEIKASFAGVK